ncbi:MAG: VWA domain-containing protein [Nitrospirae bacterium]|nr:VWA domain-containing protein [Nitrospirota bacterium]MBF0541805.1 VWA domain-containing protein [Nitrospirota bacterium]
MKTLVILLSILIFSYTGYCEDKKDFTDVVVVLDSSGSMKHTDPFNLRLPAARLFVSLLGADDRAAIESFNTKSDILIPLTMVKEAGNLDKLVNAINKVPSTGLWTNIYDALDMAYVLLDKNIRPNSKPIVILMSDGKMDTSDAAMDAKLTDTLKTTLLQKYKDRGIVIYTMAFSDESDKELLEYIAKATNGLFYVDLTSDNLHMRFTSIFENLKSPDMLPMQDNSFLVDKSIEEVTIIANKATPLTKITLVSPTKKMYTANAKPETIKWSESDKFDMMTLTAPEAGRWNIKFSTEKGNKAYIVTNLKLQTDFNNQYVKLNEVITVNSWLLKDKKIVTEPEILSKITMGLELTLPDGKTDHIALFDNGEGADKVKNDGKYAGVIKPAVAGQYTLKVKAAGSTFERSQSFTFIVLKENEVMPLTAVKSEKGTEEKGQAKALKQDIEKSLNPQDNSETAANNQLLTEKIKGLTLKKAINSFLKINAILITIVILFLLLKKAKTLRSALLEKAGKLLKGLKIKKFKK